MTEKAAVYLLRMPEVEKRTGFSKRHIYRMVRAGQFPAPLKSGRASLWRDTAVAAWQDSLTTADDLLPADLARRRAAKRTSVCDRSDVE